MGVLYYARISVTMYISLVFRPSLYKGGIGQPRDETTTTCYSVLVCATHWTNSLFIVLCVLSVHTVICFTTIYI